MIKNSSKALFILSAIALSTATAFAAQPDLYNGGLGQAATKPDSFGVAVCNRGASDTTQPVPVVVSTNGQTVQISSAPAIVTGSCEYTYLAYSNLGMQAGASYAVTVTINSADQAVYDITVPTAPVVDTAATTTSDTATPGTANILQQAGNFFAIIWKWFIGLFGIK